MARHRDVVLVLTGAMPMPMPRGRWVPALQRRLQATTRASWQARRPCAFQATYALCSAHIHAMVLCSFVAVRSAVLCADHRPPACDNRTARRLPPPAARRMCGACLKPSHCQHLRGVRMRMPAAEAEAEAPARTTTGRGRRRQGRPTTCRFATLVPGGPVHPPPTPHARAVVCGLAHLALQ
jgi:hypothetical protein